MAIVSLMTGKTTINCSFCQKNIRQLIVLLLRISKQENRSYESKDDVFCVSNEIILLRIANQGTCAIANIARESIMLVCVIIRDSP
jgi:hypothetical protein